MLFHKTVQQFHIEDYDISNETVKESLSHRYVMKLHRHTSDESDDMTTHKWPQFVPDDVKHNDIYVMNEYIVCIQDLQKQLERRVISPKKTIKICLTKYGPGMFQQIVYNCMTSHKSI